MMIPTKPNKVTPVFQLFTRSEWFLTEILELTPDCLLVIDVKTNLVVYANQASEKLYGYSQEDFIGRDIKVISLANQREIKQHMDRVIKKYPDAHRFEAIHATSTGKQVPVEVVSKLINLNGRKYYLSHITNITASKKLRNKISTLITQLSNQAYRDNLTGVYNRTYLFDVFLPKVMNRNIGLLLVNIDYFKNLNHTRGHILGDYILIETAKLLKSIVRTGGKVFRYSGGEFLVLLSKPGPDEPSQTAALISKKIALSQLMFEGQPVRYSLSVGYTSGIMSHPNQFSEFITQADQNLSQNR